jgi:hypothetical protein
LPSEADGVRQVYALWDNLNVHRATDVLLFSLAHPRWEFVFSAKYAAYVNLIAPWGKVLRSLALKGGALRAGKKSSQRSIKPSRMGTSIALPSDGGSDAGIVPSANLG